MDIVERLRKNCTCNFESTPCGAEEECRNAFDGADEIERLRKALAFYAEWGIDAPAVDAIIEEDCGDKARAALNIVLGEEE